MYKRQVSTGADLVLNNSRERIADAKARFAMLEGFDIGLEMSGAPSAVTEMLANLNHGAKMSLIHI